jgi:hypothetical protein
MIRMPSIFSSLLKSRLNCNLELNNAAFLEMFPLVL